MSDKNYDEVYHLTNAEGKAVQEILNRYVNEELRPKLVAPLAFSEESTEINKDIAYIEGLAKLFE